MSSNTIQARTKKEQKQAIEQIAEASHRTVSKFVLYCIDYAIKHDPSLSEHKKKYVH